MANELFSGLDSLIFDQPDSIDTTSFNAEEKIDSTSTDKVEDKIEITPTNKLEAKKDDLINPNDFFDKAKEADDKNDIEEDESDIKEDKVENKPEDVLKTWAEYFKENSLLVEDDLKGFDGSMESLVSAFQTRENRVGLEMVEDYKSQLPAELKILADNWEEGVPLKDLIDIRSNKIKYSKISEESLEDSVETQKAVKRDYLKRTTKYSDTKIEKEISRLIDLDELKDETKEDLVELKKLDDEAEDTLRRETKKEQEVRKQENAKTIRTYEKTVSDTKEIVPGLKLDDKIQKDVLNKIINPIGIDGYGNPVSYISSLRNEDPYKFDTAVTYLATITKGFTDWSKVIKAGETKAVKSLEDKISTTQPKSVKDNIKTTGKQSLLELLEKNKGIFGK